MSRILAHVIRPARGGAAGVVVVFALLFALVGRGSILAIPALVLLTSWFFKYAYILFDHTVWGFDEPPTLDIQLLNPFNEQRPLAQRTILGLIYVAVYFAQAKLGRTPTIVIALATAVVLPASIAILGLERHILKALNPVTWVRLIVNVGPLYFLVLAIVAGYCVLIALLQRWEVWLPVQMTINLFCILSVFSVLGGVLYERRDELGLDAWVSPERRAEAERKRDLRQSEQAVTVAYGQMRAGSHREAWQHFQTWLIVRGHAPGDYRWLCDHVVSWGDPRYITRLTQDYVDRLLTLKRNGEALDTVARRLGDDPSFRPKTATATLQIARIAVEGGGQPRVARALLADFPVRFAGDPSVPAAAALAQRLTQ